MADTQTPTEAILFSNSSDLQSMPESISEQTQSTPDTTAQITVLASTMTDTQTPPQATLPSSSSTVPSMPDAPTKQTEPAADTSAQIAVTKSILHQDASSSNHINGDNDNDPSLFDPKFISAEVRQSLPEGYTIRPLKRSDYHGEFLSTLRVLTTVGEPTPEEWNTRYTFMSTRNDTYYILVILDPSLTIVGTGAVIVERKFIHNMGLVGHIEDIAVAKNQQGKKLGLRVIQALVGVAQSVGCYKSILDCSEANEGFYVKCGFRRAGLEMACYYNV